MYKYESSDFFFFFSFFSFVQTIPDGLVDFAVGGRITGDVQNALRHVGNEDGLLVRLFALMPEWQEAELTPPERCVVSHEAISLAIHI